MPWLDECLKNYCDDCPDVGECATFGCPKANTEFANWQAEQWGKLWRWVASFFR